MTLLAQTMVVSAFSPGAGPTQGATVVTVSGMYFVDAPLVKFGTVVASRPATLLSSTQFLCVSPGAATADTVSLEVSDDDGSTFTAWDSAFVYYGTASAA